MYQTGDQMVDLKRRAAMTVLVKSAATGCFCVAGLANMARAQETNPGTSTAAEEWMERVLQTKSLDKPLAISRFVEPMYYLLVPFTWTPNPDNGPRFKPVTVPRGFVTDLASIPPLLFPVLRADGEYAQAAIVHDYLYWFQTTTREYADEVFKIAMRDLEVSPVQMISIYDAVRGLGQSAWDTNARLRASGERRVLKKFPTAANTRWAVWKQSPEFFENQS